MSHSSVSESKLNSPGSNRKYGPIWGLLCVRYLNPIFFLPGMGVRLAGHEQISCAFIGAVATDDPRTVGQRIGGGSVLPDQRPGRVHLFHLETAAAWSRI